MQDLKTQSPFGAYLDHLNRGELAYQVCTDDGAVVFYPRVVAPRSGSPNLEWRVSKGLGTVHATTVVHQKDTPPYNVALIDLDEGFRGMFRRSPFNMFSRIGFQRQRYCLPGRMTSLLNNHTFVWASWGMQMLDQFRMQSPLTLNRNQKPHVVLEAPGRIVRTMRLTPPGNPNPVKNVPVLLATLIRLWGRLRCTYVKAIQSERWGRVEAFAPAG